MELLEGKHVSLKIMEKEDLSILQGWDNNPDFMGQFEPFRQETLADLEREYENQKEGQWFFIEKKDGTKIGYAAHFISAGGHVELGYFVVPNQRGRGFASEAIRIVVDYLFLSKKIVRIQATVDPRNTSSWKALKNAGFKREGKLRKNYFCRGEWRDDYMYSILREEWNEPKILARETSK